MIGPVSSSRSYSVSAPQKPLDPIDSSSTAGRFNDMLSGLLQSTVQSLHGAETMAAAGLQGQVPVQSVVQSVATAQRNLQTLLAVRDKAVGAWQDISRMAI